MSQNKEIVDGFVVDKQGVHLDLEAVQKKVIQAADKESPSIASNNELGSESLVEGESAVIDGQLIDKHGFHINDDFLSNVSASIKINPVKSSKTNKESSSLVDLGMYQPIWDELQKIPFSDDYKNEINLIAKAVKEASRDLKVKRIIANTKVLAKNAQKFYYSDSGIRVVFSILGNKFSMAAKGDFTGMEAFYIQVNGDSLDGVILRKTEDEDYKDVTSNYNIEIKRV